MISWALIKAEWTKTMRLRMTYIAFLAVALLVMLLQFGIHSRLGKDPLTRSFEAFDFKISWIVNGYIFTQIALFIAFIVLIVPMTVMTFARQVAGESQAGTLRLILSRPIGRLALLNAKFVVCAAYSLLLMGFFFSFSFGLGVALFGWTDSIAAPSRSALAFGNLSSQYRSMNSAERESPRGRRGGQGRVPTFDYRQSGAGRAIHDEIEAKLKSMLISPVQCLKRLALAWLLTSWALLALGAIAFFYSTINRHPTAAMALTLGTFFLVYIVQGLASLDQLPIALFTSVEPYLFTKAMGYWSECFKPEIDWKEIAKDASLLGAYTVAFFGTAQLIFRRRDITG